MSGSGVGVVIPTYERVEETVRAVQSVLRQTIAADHVVVADDGSSPETVARLQEQLAQLPVEFIKAPRSAHPGRTRNAGLRVLDTQWVAFLDSDDTWAPDKLEQQLRSAGSSPAVCTNARRIVAGHPDGTVVDTLPPRVRLADLVRTNVVINSSVLIRREVLDEVGQIASSYLVRGCEDYATWLRVATRYDWATVDRPLVDYVDDPTVSIRGAEEFAIHPGQQAAWLDYVMWRRESGRPARLAEHMLGKGLRTALRLSDRRGHTHDRDSRRG